MTMQNHQHTTGVPTISVGLPVYNAERLVGSAIESVLSQSWQDFQLIISDNASTDNTYRVCEQYSRKDPRIKLLRQEHNLGAPANYRAVAAESRSPYFKWASGNDLIHTEFLATCIAALEARPDCVLAYPRTRLFQTDPEAGKDYADELNLQMDDPVLRFRAVHERLRLNNVMNGVIRHDVLSKAGLMPDFISGDMYLIAELALAGRFIEIPATMLYRRMDATSATCLQSYEQRVRHLHPGDSQEWLFPSWKQCCYSARSVFRQRLRVRDRLRALGYVSRMCYWSLPALIRDLRSAGRFLRNGSIT